MNEDINNKDMYDHYPYYTYEDLDVIEIDNKLEEVMGDMQLELETDCIW